MINPEFVSLFRLVLIGGALWGLWRAAPHMVALWFRARRKLRARGLARLKRKRRPSWEDEGRWHAAWQFIDDCGTGYLWLASHNKLRPKPYGGRPRKWFKERKGLKTKPKGSGPRFVFEYGEPAKDKRDLN